MKRHNIHTASDSVCAAAAAHKSSADKKKKNKKTFRLHFK